MGTLFITPAEILSGKNFLSVVNEYPFHCSFLVLIGSQAVIQT